VIPVPQSVRESLAQYFETEAGSLAHFGGGREESDGIVYAFPCGDSRRLLKVMVIPEADCHRGLFCLEERLRFARFMGENGAHIAFPQLSPQGNLYETVLGEGWLWVGYSMEVAPGKPKRPNAWDPAFFHNWGQTVGRLHRLAQQYPSWEHSVNPASGEAVLTWREEWDSFYHWSQDDEVKLQWLEIRRELEALPVTREVFGFVHNDPHVWNLLVDGDRITLLDFDVANHHWFVSDIAIACQSVLSFQSGGMDRPVHDRTKLLRFLELFLEGYEREHHLPSEWLDRLDLFIAYRRILLFTVMQGWIRSQPGLYQSWRGMILTRPEVVGALSRAWPGARG
jgi:Ser/Thr protein kinase RdoA (MazF antagonist)